MTYLLLRLGICGVIINNYVPIMTYLLLRLSICGVIINNYVPLMLNLLPVLTQFLKDIAVKILKIQTPKNLL